MALAAKFLDPVVGIDIHMVTLPGPPGQAPLPHAFVGYVWDPIGVALGAAMGAILGGGGPVYVNGLPCANTGTDVKGFPHFVTPPGIAPSPADPPSNSGTVVTGSISVKFMGSSEGRLGSMVSTCGYPVSLPTSVILSLPAGPAVNIGGPEGVDVMAAVTQGIRTKWVSKKLHKFAKAAKGSRRSKFICFLTGHPIDVMTGELIAEAVDFEVGGLMPIAWERNYRSRSAAVGGLGPGWSHPFDEWVDIVDSPLKSEKHKVVVHLADGRDVPHLVAVGAKDFNGENRYELNRREASFERYDLASGRRYSYAPQPGDVAGRYRLATVTNRAGAAMQCRYEGGQLTQVTDTAARKLALQWQDGRITAVMHKGQALVSYEYDGGMLAAVIDPLGHAMRYAYKGGVMVEEAHKSGLTFHFKWTWHHPEGWCRKSWGEQEGIEGQLYPRELTYDSERHITTVEDSRGRWAYFGNEVGLVDRQIDPCGAETIYKWDEHCRKTAETDALGNTQRWAFDEWGNCIEEVDALGRVLKRTFDDDTHQLRALTDAAGETWQLHHDLAGLPMAVTDPTGATTHYTHDKHGRLAQIEDPTGRTVQYRHHPDHTIAAIVDGEDRTENYGADALGRVAWYEDTNGRRTTIERDVMGRPALVRYGDGDELRLVYDAEGNVIERVNALGQRERMAYVGTGQLREYTDAAGYKVRLVYDAEEDLTHLFNEAGERYYFKRDVVGRIKVEIGFDGKRTLYNYDMAGRLTKAIGPQRGEVTDYHHDGAGQLVEVVAADPYMNKQREAFTYDARGLLIATKRSIKAGLDIPSSPITISAAPDVTVRFERDARGAIVREVQQTGDGPAFAIESRYDSGGIRVQRDSSLGHRVDYRYDQAGDLAGVELGLSEPFSRLPFTDRQPWHMQISRNAGGEESARSFPGGVQARWKRDDHGRLSERHVLTGANAAERKPGDDVMRQGYAWRSAEQLAGLQDLLSGSSRQFSHDVRGNLVQETRYPRHGQPQHPVTQYRIADKVGNLFRTTDHSDAEYATGGALKRWGSNTYEYDDAGRLATKTLADGGAWSYRWSPTGRLLTVERPDGKAVAFDYDALGRRTQKRFEGVVTSYVWDGNDLVHAQVRRADGTCAPMQTWAHEPGTFAPLVHQIGRKRYAVVADHLGTPQMLTDEQGRVAWQAQLDVYGVPMDEVGEVGQPWRYPGQLFDEETGLCYNRHRYYDPETGRYISEDPIGLLGGLALHGYVRDPMGWIDPFGLARDGINFSDHLYPAVDPQKNEVKIRLQGSRGRDFTQANKAAGLAKKPRSHTWHHLHDFDPMTGITTMQLVEKAIHKARGHIGSVDQFAKHFGVKYGTAEAVRIAQQQGWLEGRLPKKVLPCK